MSRFFRWLRRNRRREAGVAPGARTSTEANGSATSASLQIPAKSRAELRIGWFFVPLPSLMPLPPGWTFSFQHGHSIPVLQGGPMFPRQAQLSWSGNGQMFTFFTFYGLGVADFVHRSAEIAVYAAMNSALRDPAMRKELPNPSMIGTWVVGIQTPINALETTDPFDDALDRCIDDLNGFIEALRIATPLVSPLVRRETLPPKLPCLVRGADDFGWSEPEWVDTNSRRSPVGQIRVLTDIGRDELNHWLRLRGLGHPVFVVNHHIANAMAELRVSGEAGNALVQAAIACEALIDGVLRMLLWEEAADDKTVISLLKDTSVSARLKRGLAPRLPGDWNQDGKGAIGRWRQQVADPRNSLVHSAEQPTSSGALNAIGAAEELYEFLNDRLIAKVEQYPRTTCLILSRAAAAKHRLRYAALDQVLQGQREGASILQDFNRWWSKRSPGNS